MNSQILKVPQTPIDSGTQPTYVRCNWCFHVEKAAPGVKYHQEEAYTGTKSTPCSVCRKGYLYYISLETTPEKVERSRAELEADRQRNRHRDAVMLQDPNGRGLTRSYDERLRIGFYFMKGLYDDG